MAFDPFGMNELIEGQRKLNAVMQECLETQRQVLQFALTEQKQVIQEVRAFLVAGDTQAGITCGSGHWNAEGSNFCDECGVAL
jgi:hypothetical protein